MCAVLVAHDGDQSDLSECLHSVLVVEFVDEGIDTLQHPFGYARGLSYPDRRCDDDDFSGKQLFAQRRPGVSMSHIVVGAGPDVMIHCTDHFRVDIETAQLADELRKQSSG